VAAVLWSMCLLRVILRLWVTFDRAVEREQILWTSATCRCTGCYICCVFVCCFGATCWLVPNKQCQGHARGLGLGFGVYCWGFSRCCRYASCCCTSALPAGCYGQLMTPVPFLFCACRLAMQWTLHLLLRWGTACCTLLSDMLRLF
jgi:hypothetical protein